MARLSQGLFLTFFKIRRDISFGLVCQLPRKMLATINSRQFIFFLRKTESLATISGNSQQQPSLDWEIPRYFSPSKPGMPKWKLTWTEPNSRDVTAWNLFTIYSPWLIPRSQNLLFLISHCFPIVYFSFVIWHPLFSNLLACEDLSWKTFFMFGQVWTLRTEISFAPHGD